MKNNATATKQLNRKGWKVLFLSLLSLAGATILQIIGYVLAAALGKSGGPLATLAAVEGITAGSLALVMLIMGGRKWLTTSHADLKEAFRAGWPIIVADIALFAISLVAFAIEGNAAVAGWLPNLVMTVLVSLGIGLAEEFLYRGVLLNSVLAVAGRSHRGTMIGVVVVSIMFGLGHVDTGADFATPFMAAQALLKIVQTGLFSMLMCSVVLRTHKLGGVSLFHGLNDFLLMAPGLVLAGEQLSTNYVSTGDEGAAGIVVYLVTIAFYLPMVIKALRKMHREQVTYRGVFMERTMATIDETPSNEAGPTLPLAGMPDAA